MRLRRSELSTPASNERMIESAARSDADLVFLDLEDAVAPAEKPGARGRAVGALRELDWGARVRAVRINGVDTQWAYQDVIDVVLGARDALDVLIVPKVRAPRDVWWVETLLDQLELEVERNEPVALEALIEEAEAVGRVEEIARSSRRLEALIVGFGDLSASQGMPPGGLTGAVPYPGDIWHHVRARTVLAARAAGIEPIDGPYPNFRDGDGYRDQAALARALGFSGKWAIHPSQIAPANDVFSPSEDEVRTARGIVEAYREAERAGSGAAGHSGALIDAAAVRMMEGTLAKAELIERRSG